MTDERETFLITHPLLLGLLNRFDFFLEMGKEIVKQPLTVDAGMEVEVVWNYLN